MKKLARTAAVGAAAVAAVLGTVAPASADVQPTVAFAGPVVVAQGGEVTLRITYTCTGQGVSGNHLYAAVKQGPRVNTTDRSSSQYAVSYYSTNWSVDQGPNALNCDGTEHTQTLVLTPEKGGNQLHSGRALVQLCLFDNITGEDPVTHEPNGGADFDYTMQRVFVVR